MARNQKRELVKKLGRERVIISSYKQQKNELLQQSQQDRTNFLNALRNKQQNINELETFLENSDDLLADKNQQITNKNQIISQLQSQLANANLTETERDNYLAELNELEQDFREQERLLAGKNAKLAEAIANQNNLQTQINNHVCPVPPVHTCEPCSLIHLPEPHECPIKIDCSAHNDYEEVKKQRDDFQTKLSSQELEIIQRLNNTFKLGLDPNEKDLNQVISKLKELIDKPPLTIEDEIIKQELIKAQGIVTKLEKELTEKTIGENIKEIIKIDEKLLNENEALKVELNKKVSDYQELAQERNRLVLQEIKNINVAKLQEIMPKVKKQEIKRTLEQAKNYEELSSQRNKLIVKYISSQNQVMPQKSELENSQPFQGRIILIGFLLISLLTISELLARLRNTES